MTTACHGASVRPSVHTAKGLLLLGVLFSAISGIAQAQPNILIVAGNDGVAQSATSALATELANAGDSVSTVTSGVPADIITPGFTQIYDLRYNNNPTLSAGERSQYLAFLNAAPGNTLILIGE